MTFDWSEYLSLGRTLAGAADEASHRSAISRAYYSAYCTARNWMLARGYEFRSRRHAHSILWNEFANQISREFWEGMAPEVLRRARAIGNDGYRLAAARSRADYDDSYPFLQRDLLMEMRRAMRMHEGLGRL